MTTESKMTTMQEILANDFGGKLPTLDQIIAKFPPAEETFTAKGIEFSRKVSRASNGAIIYIAPPKEA